MRKCIQGGKQFRKNNSICEIVSNSEWLDIIVGQFWYKLTDDFSVSKIAYASHLRRFAFANRRRIFAILCTYLATPLRLFKSNRIFTEVTVFLPQYKFLALCQLLGCKFSHMLKLSDLICEYCYIGTHEATYSSSRE